MTRCSVSPVLLLLLPLTACAGMGPLFDRIPVSSNEVPSRLQAVASQLDGSTLADAMERVGCPSFAAVGGRFHVWVEWRPRAYNLRGLGIDWERFVLAVEVDDGGRIRLVRLWLAEADVADAFVQELVEFTTSR